MYDYDLNLNERWNRAIIIWVKFNDNLYFWGVGIIIIARIIYDQVPKVLGTSKEIKFLELKYDS